MMTSKRLMGGFIATVAALALAAAPAVAQKAPPTKPAAKTAAPTATKTKTAARKSTSPCKGLSKSQCGGNKACGWIEPKKKVDKRGRKLTAYCRKVAGIAKKKAKN